MNILGIDIGGSGIKAAIVDTTNGTLLTERHRIETPEGAKKEDVRKAIVDVVAFFKWEGAVGCGFPAAINNGTVLTASNIDTEWIGTNIPEYFGDAIKNPIFVLNDADAAAMAEMNFGNGKDKKGVVLLLTVGTGIGSAIFHNNMLIPNLELGQIYMKKGTIGEKYASAHVREVKNLSLKGWAIRFNKYLLLLESYIYPDLIIVGGGISRKFAKFAPHLITKAQIVPALLENNAGIIGAACYASLKSS